MSNPHEAVLAEFERVARIIADPRHQAEVERLAYPKLHAAWEADRRFRARSLANGHRTVLR